MYRAYIIYFFQVTHTNTLIELNYNFHKLFTIHTIVYTNCLTYVHIHKKNQISDTHPHNDTNTLIDFNVHPGTYHAFIQTNTQPDSLIYSTVHTIPSNLSSSLLSAHRQPCIYIQIYKYTHLHVSAPK